MRKFALLKPLLFTLVVMLCITSLIVNVQAESWSWSKVASPTGEYFESVDMVSSNDGWIVGADGIYRWQEKVAGFPTAYLIIIIAVVAVVVVWFFTRNRLAHKRTERVVSAC